MLNFFTGSWSAKSIHCSQSGLLSSIQRFLGIFRSCRIQSVRVFVLHITGLKYHRRFEGFKVVSLIEIILPSYLELPKPLLTWTFSEDLEEWTNDGDNWSHKWKVSSVRNQTLLCLQTKPTQPSRQSILLSRKKDAAKPNIRARLLSPPIPSDLSLRCLVITYTFNLGPGLDIPKAVTLSLLQRQRGCLWFHFHVVFHLFHKFICSGSIPLKIVSKPRCKRWLKGIGPRLPNRKRRKSNVNSALFLVQQSSHVD